MSTINGGNPTLDLIDNFSTVSGYGIQQRGTDIMISRMVPYHPRLSGVYMNDDYTAPVNFKAWHLV